MKKVQNFYIYTAFNLECPSNECYKILASPSISKMLGREVIATCSSLDDAQWLCGVLEFYVLMTNNISSAISKVLISK